MHGKVKRYKVTFVSMSGGELSFKTLALHHESVLEKIIRHISKKMDKTVEMKGKKLLIDGKQVAELKSIEKIISKKKDTDD